MSKRKIPDEEDDRPTEPAAPRVTCPSCKGDGHFMRLTETAAGYRSRRIPCPTCDGEGKIDRRAYEAWRAMHEE